MKLNLLNTVLIGVLTSTSLFAQKGNLIATIELQAVTCFGEANGSISVTPSGGYPPYTYSWSNGDTTSTLSNLTAGVYGLTIYDADSSIISSSISVTQPDEILIDGTITDVSNSNGDNGEINISLLGALPNYTFNWTTTNGSGLSNSILDQANLSVGDYALTLTNPNGCSASATFTIINTFVQINQPASQFSVAPQKNINSVTAVSNLFPNPSNGHVTFKHGSEVSKIEIFASSGKQIRSIQIDESNMTDEFTQYLEKGTYYVHFISANQMSEIKTLVIQ